jgi:flavin reductase (DIM6/NTAB) family NADH-FMN oxidoreductase RutF
MIVDAAAISSKDAYGVLTTVVVPRPIGWVATSAGAHVNLAPFSYFNALCSDPPIVMLSIADPRQGGSKDTLRLLQASGRFVVNLVEAHDLERMNQCAAELGADVSEAVTFGIDVVPFGGAYRVVSARSALSCRVVDVKRYGRKKAVTMVVGEVEQFYLDDAIASVDDVAGLRVDGSSLKPVGRLDGNHYLVGGQRVVAVRP